MWIRAGGGGKVDKVFLHFEAFQCYFNLPNSIFGSIKPNTTQNRWIIITIL